MRAGVHTVRESLTTAPAHLEQTRQRVVQTPVLGTGLHATREFLSAVTPVGRWCASGMVLSGILAGRFHWLEAWTLSIALGVLLLIAVLWSIGRTTYKVAISLVSNRVMVGDSALGNVTLTNPSARPTSGAVIEMPVGQGLAIFHIPRLPAQAEHEEVFTIPTKHRGLVSVGPVTSVRGDSLGIIRRAQRWTDPVDLYIHPRTVSLDSTAIGFIRDIEGAVTQDLSSSDVSFHALRDYTPGDDRRNVHWKTTARTRKLMVRQFEETRRAHLLIVLDINPDSWASEDDFETGISLASSLILAVMRENREVSLISQDGMPLLPTPIRAMDTMTVINPVKDRGTLVDIARRGARSVPQASVTILITGSETSPEMIHHAHAELPVSTRSLAFRVDGSIAMESRQIAGLPVLTVPMVDHLPAALRKAG